MVNYIYYFKCNICKARFVCTGQCGVIFMKKEDHSCKCDPCFGQQRHFEICITRLVINDKELVSLML